jgi:hypothetical protein
LGQNSSFFSPSHLLVAHGRNSFGEIEDKLTMVESDGLRIGARSRAVAGDVASQPSGRCSAARSHPFLLLFFMAGFFSSLFAWFSGCVKGLNSSNNPSKDLEIDCSSQSLRRFPSSDCRCAPCLTLLPRRRSYLVRRPGRLHLCMSLAQARSGAWTSVLWSCPDPLRSGARTSSRPSPSTSARSGAGTSR